MTPLKQERAPTSTISWPQWALATATGSTLGALLGGALITAWLQPFKSVTSPLEAIAIAVPHTAGALGVRALELEFYKR